MAHRFAIALGLVLVPALASSQPRQFTSVQDLEGALYDCPESVVANAYRAQLWYEVVHGKAEKYERITSAEPSVAHQYPPGTLLNQAAIPLQGRITRVGDAQFSTLVEISPDTLAITSVMVGQRNQMVCKRR